MSATIAAQRAPLRSPGEWSCRQEGGRRVRSNPRQPGFLVVVKQGFARALGFFLSARCSAAQRAHRSSAHPSGRGRSDRARSALRASYPLDMAVQVVVAGRPSQDLLAGARARSRRGGRGRPRRSCMWNARRRSSGYRSARRHTRTVCTDCPGGLYLGGSDGTAGLGSPVPTSIALISKPILAGVVAVEHRFGGPRRRCWRGRWRGPR